MEKTVNGVKTSVSRARLLKLADFLEKLPRKRFDYGRWVGVDWDGKPDLSCGTTACALGWATTIPSFRRLGLRLRKLGGTVSVVELENDDGQETHWSAAAMNVFGLDANEAFYLFLPGFGLAGMKYHSPRHDATAKQVAKHIRRFVKERR